jgi:hypothetical protein
LQASSQLCEDLLQEQSNANIANRTKSRGKLLFYYVDSCDCWLTKFHLHVTTILQMKLLQAEIRCFQPKARVGPLRRRREAMMTASGWCSEVTRAKGAMSWCDCGPCRRCASAHYKHIYSCLRTHTRTTTKRICDRIG